MKKTTLLFISLFACLLTGCSEDTIDVSAMGTITGTVVLEGTNDPLENVKISTNPATSTVFTDENGSFILSDVSPGDYSVQAMKEGLQTQFEGATVLPEAEVNVIFEMISKNSANKPPSTPVAINPEDGVNDVAPKVDFAWDATDPENDSLTFILEIRNSSNADILTFSNIKDTTYTVDGLQYGRKYFWQIEVTDGFNEPVLSPIFSFETLDFPDSNNRFLYVRTIAGNNVIFSSDELGNELQLTSSTTNSFRPRKNNNVHKIAFLRTVGAQTHLFTMNFDGSQELQVTSTIPVNGFNLNRVDFSWANDGASLIYPNFSELYRIQSTGGGNSMIYQTPDSKFITEVNVSADDSMMALVTNDPDGYGASIYTIDMAGNKLVTVLENAPGAMGGIDLSVNNQYLLYSYDVSGFESPQYRQLNSQLFIYDLQAGTKQNISDEKLNGTLDQDPRFSPNEAQIIFSNTSNDGLSPSNIYKTNITNSTELTRTLLFENTQMPDWE